MTIEDIMKMWGEDSHIDDKDLDNESLKIPNLHQKYLNIYSKEKRKLSDLKTHWKVLFQQRWEVVISKNGKAPDHNIRISRVILDIGCSCHLSSRLGSMYQNWFKHSSCCINCSSISSRSRTYN